MSETPFDQHQLSTTPQEHLATEKQALWEQRSTELDRMADKLGKGLDGGIKETVVALNVLNINTIQSCEGHIDWGTGAPWVELQAPDAAELENQMYEAFERARAKAEQDNRQQVTPGEIEQLFTHAHELRVEVKQRNLQEATMTIGLFEAFYRERDVPFDRRLILHISSTGRGRIESQGAEFQETAPPETKQQKLAEYQQEMTAFTTFLKDKYFSS